MTAAAPAAVAAFLRGVERRAALFAQLQCGDPTHGDNAQTAAMRAFVGGAGQVATADWPRRFWALLLASPQLRRAPGQSWPKDFALLARLGNGPRAALLLHVVAALSDEDAAAVLDVAVPTFRLALQRALPRRGDGSLDADAWRTLDTAARQALRQLPAARLVQFARLREAALSARAPQRRQTPRRATTAPRALPGWLLPLLWVALAACAAGLAATFLRPALSASDAGDEVRIRRTPLPAAAAPVGIFDADTALLSHRDFEQLADNADAALLRELDFYGWYAAERATQPAAALPLPDAAQTLPDAAANDALEDADAPR